MILARFTGEFRNRIPDATVAETFFHELGHHYLKTQAELFHQNQLEVLRRAFNLISEEANVSRFREFFKTGLDFDEYFAEFYMMKATNHNSYYDVLLYFEEIGFEEDLNQVFDTFFESR